MARAARELQAQAAQKAETKATSAPPSVTPTDPFVTSSTSASPRVGDALLALGGSGGPIDPTIRLLAQAEVAYAED